MHSAQNFGANNFVMTTFFLFFTKWVAVRAAELSTGAFCTEFRCEQLCDDDIFGIGINFETFHEKGRCESCGLLDLTIVHRISVRATL